MAHSRPRPEAVEQKGIDFHAGYSTRKRESQRCPRMARIRRQIRSLMRRVKERIGCAVIELINRVKYFTRIISRKGTLKILVN